MGTIIYVQRTKPKIISITDVKRVKQFNIKAVIPIEPQTKDADLKHDMKTIQGNEDEYVFHTLVTEVLKKPDAT